MIMIMMELRLFIKCTWVQVSDPHTAQNPLSVDSSNHHSTPANDFPTDSMFDAIFIVGDECEATLGVKMARKAVQDGVLKIAF